MFPAVPPTPLVQQEYVTYTQYLQDLDVIEKCCRKQEVSRIGYSDNHFYKLEKSRGWLGYISLMISFFGENDRIFFNPSSEHGKKILQDRVSFINKIHQKFENDLKNRKPDDCTPLAAQYYLNHLKTMERWNQLFSNELQITILSSTPQPTFSTKSLEQVLDAKADYHDFLAKFPKLHFENNHTDGAYEIVYDTNNINEIRKATYDKIYATKIKENWSPEDAHDYAMNSSRIGIIAEDEFWIWIRDAVISSQGYKHTYNRLIWKSGLKGHAGAAVLPIIRTPEGFNVVLQVAHRHATGSFEFEIARGAAKDILQSNGEKVKEDPKETASRELQEETGYSGNLTFLGYMTPDTGALETVVPIYLGEVTQNVGIKHDKTEAINERYLFSLKEIEQGLKQGYLEVKVKGIQRKVNLRDPFLTYALLLAEINHLL